MKLVLILFIAGFAGYTKASQYYDEIESIGLVQAFGVRYLSSVSYNQCPEGVEENIKKEGAKAIECIKNIRYNSSFCNTFVHHFKPCVHTILEETAKCDRQEVTELKHVILDSVIEEAKFLCEIDGEHILEILNPCILKSIHKSDECRKNVLAPLHYSRDIKNLCGKFSSLQKCFDDQVQQECVNDITKTTIHDFFSVDVKPCNIVMEMFLELGHYF